jgi:putative component of toxin-antitoxin plasmid stabilization module
MEIVKYQLEDGKIPFDSWLRGLRDARAKARILIRLKRMEKGNEAVILLCGGNKSSQQNDIKVAKEYWRNYRENS